VLAVLPFELVKQALQVLDGDRVNTSLSCCVSEGANSRQSFPCKPVARLLLLMIIPALVIVCFSRGAGPKFHSPK
jgi:hypothetical protein